MSNRASRVLTLILIIGVMTTCLSLYLSRTSQKLATQFSARNNPQLRVRHSFEALKGSRTDVPRGDFRLVIHGGAGVVSKEIDSKPFYEALTRIISNAYRFAKAGKNASGKGPVTALDIVEFTVRLLEDDPLFNAGRGAVFTADETHEMEASIMSGSDLKCGAVSLVKSVKNPITLARTVMEKTKHSYLVGDSAEKLAVDMKLERMDESYFSTDKRREQLMKAKESDIIVNDHDLDIKKQPIVSLPPPLSVVAANFSSQIDFGVRILRDEQEEGSTDTESVSGEVSIEDTDRRESEKQDELDAMFPGSIGTVGCVCMFGGHVAAATSTGGLTNKMAGRIGDTPIIGAGTYANDATCAVSATGKGEEFMRHVAAYDVSARIEIGGLSLKDAVSDTVYKKLPAGSGGLIAINALGEYSMEFNSKGMFRGVCESSGECSVGIWEEMVPFLAVEDSPPLVPPSILMSSEVIDVEETRSIPLQ